MMACEFLVYDKHFGRVVDFQFDKLLWFPVPACCLALFRSLREDV